MIRPSWRALSLAISIALVVAACGFNQGRLGSADRSSCSDDHFDACPKCQYNRDEHGNTTDPKHGNAQPDANADTNEHADA